MELVIVFIALVSALFCPVLGIIVTLIYLFVSNKKSMLMVWILTLIVGYLGSFYLPNYTDDMTRYIFFMQKISVFSFGNFFKQLYSSNPISVYGLSGTTWPGSALILYVTSRWGSYRIISAVSLAVVVVVRIIPITSFFRQSFYKDRIKYAILFVTTVIWIRPLLPLSGFRWFMAISVLMFIIYKEIISGFKWWHLLFYVISVSLHPAVLVFILLKLVTLAFSRSKKCRYMGIVILFIGFASYGFGAIRTFVNSLFMQFNAYSDDSLRAFQTFLNIFLLFILIFLFIETFKIKRGMVSSKKMNLNYASLIIIFNIFLIVSPVFDRFTQFTIPMTLIILSEYLLKKERWNLFEYIYIFLLFSVGLFTILHSPSTSLPSFFEPITSVFFETIHF